MRRLRVAILGGGGILSAHLEGFRAVADRCEIVAVAEASPNRDDFLRKAIGPDVTLVRDYREAIARADVEAVDILLPHHLHMPATVAAAQAGKHVLVEKVMARNVWECDRMIEACEGAGVTLTVCHDRRYHAEWRALYEIVASGVLGEIFFWKLDHNQDVAIPRTSWAYWKDGIGGGCLMSCLTHQIDALRWYGGEIAQVTAMTVARPERMEGEFAAVMAAKMTSGALAELSINWWTCSNSGPNRLWCELVQVCGTKGEAYRMDGRGVFLRLHGADNAALARYGESVTQAFVKVESGTESGHVGCLREWVNMLLGLGGKVLTSGRECRGTVEAAEAAYRSVESGRAVRLPIRPRRWKPYGMPEAVTGLAAARNRS
jgi:predicted dehydrogenase